MHASKQATKHAKLSNTPCSMPMTLHPDREERKEAIFKEENEQTPVAPFSASLPAHA
jgi:hypothetical protein